MQMIDEYITEQSKSEINSKIFYKISFSIKDINGELDLLWEVVLHIKRWLDSKERKQGIIHVPRDMRSWTFFKNGTKLFDENNRKIFYAESIKRINPDNQEDVSWTCRIRECQNEKGYAPRWWTTEVGFQTLDDSSARLTFVVSFGDAMGFIGECLPEPNISVPGIVKNIQSDERFYCLINDEPLLFEAIELVTGRGLAFKEQIFDKDRGIPLILIMPKVDYWDKDKINLPVDPQKMIESVAGNALVYYSTDMSFVDEMRYVMDSDYRCTAGMIRYYLPNIDPTNSSDSYRHRFIHYDEAVEMGEKTILKIFRRVVAQDINDYDKLFRFTDCEELIRKDILQSRFLLLKKKQEETSKLAADIKDDYKSQLDIMEYEKLEVEIENDDLKNELSSTKKEVFGLQSQLDSFLAAYEPLKQSKEAYDIVRGIDDYPQTPEQIVGYFFSVFSDRLDLTENGWKSLKNCLTSPAILWEALYSMCTTLYECFDKCNTFNEACTKYNEQSKFECVPGNTSTTKKDKDISKEYEDVYKNTTINIEAHIKSNTGKESDPRFLRIYFNDYVDKQNGKRRIVIGSCGCHLTTAGTMHRK